MHIIRRPDHVLKILAGFISSQETRVGSLLDLEGKLFERVVLSRLQPFLEDSQLFPDTLFGYRPSLSTQDVLLQLKEDVVDGPTTAQTRAILALDLKGAFDNVSHDLILDNLASSQCGARTYGYARAFLSDRTATIGNATGLDPIVHPLQRGYG
ncbi:uncharacterized protein LOC119442280 [Dermacentor silvarum]|uniref:uncharacterized protein LOC119442280 n=1 Tax=Dermacentor silvarum TaxID=543639 RepID=UPI001898586B|nr:uncharacterized protein LOC119442280 [Dermacentor silvarum]